MQQALLNESESLANLDSFEESFSESREILSQWRVEIQLWERDKCGKNPYESRVSSR